jgi:hypothetical protein
LRATWVCTFEGAPLASATCFAPIADFARGTARQRFAANVCFGSLADISQKGEIQMPTKVNLELIIVWACVGFFTGGGWALVTWLVGRILGLIHL